MTRQELHAAARRAPFEPFRVIISTGAVYEIHHPNLIMVGQHSVILGIPTMESGPEFYSRTIKIDLDHVVGIEDIPSSSSSKPKASS